MLEMFAKQANHIVSAAEILARMGGADRSTRKELNKKLHEVENLADDGTHDVLQKVAHSFVLPYDREDVYALVSTVDDIVDLIDEAGDNMVLYRIGHLPEKALELIEIINKCAVITNEAMKEIASMGDHTKKFWMEINQLENQGDIVYRKLMREIFADDDANAMEVLKIKFVVDALEAAIDSFETLAVSIEGIAIKES
ncbi:DUF47 domain-containing protein [Arcanobacterium haemolyticum]|uniref:DUF47 domain-containing protein n=1 Tax=Arcanobacterium haemolyticum TaxID=28264 RepID=UPI000302D78F|nr:DUF47 family protein [Arcanobacterium haemolyticum]